MQVHVDKKPQMVLNLLVLSVILTAHVFLFVPFTLYTGNIEEFTAPAWSILRLICIPALAITALLVIIGGFMKGVSYRRYIVLIATAGILFWVQGYLLVWEYGLLDGSNIDWERAGWRGWVDLGIWSGVIILTQFKYKSMEKPLINLAIAIFSLQLLMLTITGIRNLEELAARAESVSTPDALVEMHRFSSVNNVLHIILDGFQSDVFREIVTDRNEGMFFQSALDGFIYFEENMGVYPSTYLSLPAILSGEIYRNDISKKEFIKNTFGGNTILNSAYKAGYEVDLASAPFMINLLTKGNYTNSYVVLKNFHVTNRVNTLHEFARLLDLTLFRLSPHFLKKHVYNRQRWVIQNLFADAESLQFYYFSHNVFLNDLRREMKVDRHVPVYKFFHLMNTHAPMVVDRNCRYAGGSLPRNRLTVTSQSRCSLYYVIALLDKMKEVGIYDEALIIIMADHGAHLPPYRFKPQKIIDNDIVFQVDPWIAAMVTPLMMIKAPGASGNLKISAAPTSVTDTAATISSILGLDAKFNGRTVMEISETEQRERRHYYYQWKPDDNYTDYTDPIQEFIVNGSVYDNATWRLGREFPPPPE